MGINVIDMSTSDPAIGGENEIVGGASNEPVISVRHPIDIGVRALNNIAVSTPPCSGTPREGSLTPAEAGMSTLMVSVALIPFRLTTRMLSFTS